jgi:hypothetical protein
MRESLIQTEDRSTEDARNNTESIDCTTFIKFASYAEYLPSLVSNLAFVN